MDKLTNPLPVRPIPESYWVIPGRFLAGEYPARPYDEPGSERRLDAFLEAGFNTFIDLTSDGELEGYSSMLRERAGYYEMIVECLHYPIGDYGLPGTAQMKTILDEIERALGNGRKIYLHCYAGIGRTGTTVGCYLVRQGRTGEQALQDLAEWWRAVPKSAYNPSSPETARQREFVLNWNG